MSAHGVPMKFDGSVVTPKPRIRFFVDIRDIATMDIPPVEYLVPALGIARNTITLWTGPDGDGKTYLAQVMALAVARGEAFLGMQCHLAPVLYIDLENPGYVVKDRIQSLLADGSTPPDLRFWGTWLPIDQQPPQAGSELLLTICKEAKPLLIVDPFRYFHNGEENGSTAMSGIMQYLRACAALRCGRRHPAPSSQNRGLNRTRLVGNPRRLRSGIPAHAGQGKRPNNSQSGQEPTRPSRTITVRADFEEGRFEMSEAPYITRRNGELAKLEEIIGANPGIAQNAICKQFGGRRNRIVNLLKQGTGTRWTAENGKHGANLYHLTAKSLYPKGGTADTASFEETCIAVSTPLGVVQDTGLREGKGLPSCSKCGSFALFEGVCQSCAPRQ